MGNANDDTMAMPAINPVILEVVQRNVADFQASANQRIESLQGELANREAELLAVRSDVQRLIWGDFMPTPRIIERALFPSAERVAQFRKEPAT